MSTTQPIRKKEDIRRLKNYFLERKQYRNYLMVTIGLNTALRISDILDIKWCDVYNEETHRYQTHIHVTEQKTHKKTCIYLNRSVITALRYYRKTLESVSPSDYLFIGQKNATQPISRTQAFRIIKDADLSLNLGGNISCHSMRKTFGYQASINGVEPVLLMNIYNHSSYEITKRYLCIDQDDKDMVFHNVNL